MVTIYISSPYSIGNPEDNVRVSFEAARKLVENGFGVMCPLVGHYLNRTLDMSYEQWMSQDLDWVSRCDGVLRLPGESKGADMETALAEKRHIPVFRDIDELCRLSDDVKILSTGSMVEGGPTLYEASFKFDREAKFVLMTEELKDDRVIRVKSMESRFGKGKQFRIGKLEWEELIPNSAKIVKNHIKWIDYGKYKPW